MYTPFICANVFITKHIFKPKKKKDNTYANLSQPGFEGVADFILRSQVHGKVLRVLHGLLVGHYFQELSSSFNQEENEMHSIAYVAQDNNKIYACNIIGKYYKLTLLMTSKLIMSLYIN